MLPFRDAAREDVPRRCEVACIAMTRDCGQALYMPTFALIHGAGDVGWYWHLIEAQLRAQGHVTVAPDLPVDDDSAGLSVYADVVVDAVGGGTDVVVVGQSLGGYVAPIVAERIGAGLIVLVAGMIPSPGESAEEMFQTTGWRPEPLADNSTRNVFYQDVPPNIADEALRRGRSQSDTPGREPWPLAAWPEIPTRFVLGRNDRFFPAAWLRTVVADRLGFAPDEIDSGHCPALSRPRELAARLTGFLASESGFAGQRSDVAGAFSRRPTS
jgi:pimeloyl-ACP methyl ester carboxylesterase